MKWANKKAFQRKTIYSRYMSLIYYFMKKMKDELLKIFA